MRVAKDDGMACGAGTVAVDGICVATDTGEASAPTDTGEPEPEDADGDGYTVEAGDCDDQDESRSPGRVEVCDGVDNDCNGLVDDEPEDALTWFLDYDGDGYGNPDWPSVECDAPSGHVDNSDDCDDANDARNPGAAEYCDGVDNDCDGAIDEDALDPEMWFLDHDFDGFGDPGWSFTGCDAPFGYVADSADCDDGDDAVNPSAPEECDGIDNDCDGTIDEAGSITAYVDGDGDGYGSEPITVSECDSVAGTSTLGGDCDDTRADVHPGAFDALYDGIDSDCAGGSEWDGDSDGFDDPSGGGDDCDDSDALTHPGADDPPYDGYDADCGGDDDYDVDGDGFVPSEYEGSATGGVDGSGDLPSGDCDDDDAAVHPGAVETPEDGVDSDCDGEDGVPGLTGETGDAWLPVSSGPSMRGLQEYTASGATHMYVGNGTNFSRMNLASESWETLSSPPGSLAAWGSAALGNDEGYWQIRTSTAYRYDVESGSWSSHGGFPFSGGDEQSMTVTDSEGRLWAYQGGGLLVRYDPSSDLLDTFSVEIPPYTFETRVGYDGPTNSIFFGGFADDEVYQYDIDADWTDTGLTRHPEGYLNDIFCSDRNGHLYAAGGSGGSSLWQYDIATDTWDLIPDYPTDHGNNGSCSVSMDGWLYMEPGDVSTIYKLPLY